jgi:tetrahydromethanopterin S-methyltransferase subunit G
MGEKIRENPILYAIVNFALCLITVIIFAKFYIDYRFNDISDKVDNINSNIETIIEYLELDE